ncbi:MAG TPA: glycosyltransferase [Candidatus Saccharimonadales bacterium]|nr:glycosyltransferase [Candidatus Saccharimonadales bacterium]
MRIALVGPTHPFKGGIAHHTTELAHKLKGEGHDVSLISWSSQYPSILYPGIQKVPDDKPETAVFGDTSYPLSWKNPAGWVQVGKRLRKFDMVIFVFVTSIQAPAYLTMLKSLGKNFKGETIALCHNVLPHERRFFDLPLTKAVLGKVDRLLVHTPSQASLAKTLTKAEITMLEMPPHLPATAKSKHSKAVTRHLLFFGMVRKYKGVDVLLRALAEVPDVTLTVAGEIWGGTEKYDQLMAELGVADRVKLLSGYVPSQEIPKLFGEADALVLPYRSGTATQNVTLAFAHGLPVVATTVGSMAKQVRNDKDGILCSPDDVADLAAAIKHLYEPGVLEKLRKNLPDVSGKEEWKIYIAGLVAEKS